MRVRWNGNTYLMTWICVFDNVRIRARWIGPYAWRNVRTPFRGCSPRYRRPFAAVGSRFIVPAYTYSPRIRNPFEMPSRNVRNMFILCVLHIRRAKVWFLRHKSMVFGVPKTPFLHCKNPLFEIPKWGSEFRAYTAILKHRNVFCCHTNGRWICKKMIR